MKSINIKKVSMGLITMAMLGSASIQAQTFLTDSYTNTFDLGSLAAAVWLPGYIGTTRPGAIPP
jgi:hypothetical protein